LNVREVWSVTVDASGNLCGFLTTVKAPVADSTSSASKGTFSLVGTTLFNAPTASGTRSFSAYSGGTCSGATFNMAGATLRATFTTQFVVSEGGSRVDEDVTAFTTSPVSFIAAVVLHLTSLRVTNHD
jgi:hypothetical protein